MYLVDFGEEGEKEAGEREEDEEEEYLREYLQLAQNVVAVDVYTSAKIMIVSAAPPADKKH